MADANLLKSGSPLLNYIDNAWQESTTDELLDVTNPATGEVITQVPLSPAEEVNQAATAAATAAAPETAGCV